MTEGKKKKKGDDGKRDTVKNPNTSAKGGIVKRPGLGS
jgi:hypothetical protein|tara:strand:+ start:69 stop:182 length:114 start_codon:yes stop_codon:yes gene_type:complete